MPYAKVIIHYIWSTKNRVHSITKELKPLLLQHIKDNSITAKEYNEFLKAHHFEIVLAKAILLILNLNPRPEGRGNLR